MAKPYDKMNKTIFVNSYNITKVLITKSEIMKYLETYKDDNKHAVAFGELKQPRDRTPSWFTSWFKEFEKKINDRFERIESRLISIEEKLIRNNIN